MSVSTTLRAIIAADAGSAESAFADTASAAEKSATSITSSFEEAGVESSAATEGAAARIAASYEGLSAEAEATFAKIIASADGSNEEIVAATDAMAAKTSLRFDELVDNADKGFAKIAESASKAATDESASSEETTARIAELYDDMAASVSAAFDKIAEAATAAAGETEEDQEAATAKVAALYDALATDVSAAYAKIDEAAAVAGRGAVAETEESTDAMSGSMSKFSEVGAAAFGVVVIGSLDMADKFDAASNQIAASAGISQDAAQKMGTALLNAANGTIFSGTEMASAYAQVAGQLKAVNGGALSTAQGVGVMTAANDLAAASGDSLSGATSDVVSILQAYGLKVSDAANVSNILYSAANLTGQGVDTEAAALTKLKTKLGDLAPPIAQMAGLQVDLAEHGESGRASMSALTTAFTTLLKPASDAATAQSTLKAALAALPPTLQGAAKAYQDGQMSAGQLTTYTKGLSGSQEALFAKFTSAASAANTANQAQAKLGITTVNAKGQVEPMADIIGQLHDKLQGLGKAQQIAELTAMGFGSSSSKLVGIIDAGPAAYNKATAAVDRQKAAHEAAQKATDNFKDQLKVLGGEFENEAVKVGNVLMPKIEALMHGFETVISWVMKTKAVLIPLGVVIGGVMVAATAAFAINGIGKMSRSISSAYGEITTLGTKLLGLVPSFGSTASAAEASSAEVESSLGATGDAAAAAATEVDSSAEGMAASQEAVQLSFQETAAVGEQMSLDLSTSFETAGAAADEFAATADTAGEAAGAGMDAALGPIGLLILAGTLIATHWKEVSKLLIDAWHGIEDAAKFVFHHIVEILEIAGEAMLTAIFPAAGIAVILATHWKEVERFAKDIFGDVVKFLKRWGLDILEAVVPAVGIVEFLAHNWRKVESDAKAIWDDILKFFESIPGKILHVFESAGTWLVHIGEEILEGWWKGIEAEVSLVTRLGKDVYHWVLEGLKDAGTWLVSIGKDIVHGLIKGIEDMASAPGRAIKDAAHGVISVAKSILGVFSPSTVFAEIGKNVMQGLAQGISENKALATAEMKALDIGKELIADMKQIGSAALAMGTTFRQAGTSVTVMGTAARTGATAVQSLRVALTAVGSALQQVSSVGRTAFTGMVSGISAVQASVGAFGEEWTSVWTSADNALSDFWSDALPIFQEVKEQGLDYVRIATDVLTQEWVTDWNLIRSTMVSTWGQLQSIFSQLRTTGLMQLQTSANTLATDWATDWQKITSAVSSAQGSIDGSVGAVNTAVTGLDSSLSKLSGDWGSTWSSMAATVTSAFPNPSSMLYGIGQDLMTGLVQGIDSEASSVAASAANAAAQAAASAKNQVKAHSPSQVFHDIGASTMQGMALGISDNAHLVHTAMQAVVRDVATTRFTLPNASNTAATAAGSPYQTTAPGATSAQSSQFATTVIQANLIVDGQQLASVVSAPLRTQYLQQKRAIVNLGLE